MMFAEPIPTEIVYQVSEEKMNYQTFKSSQGKIAFIDTGGSGFPIVLVHGNSCSSEVFKKQIDAFCNSYRIITMDLPGHGRSSCPNDPDKVYNIPGYAEIIHELVSHLKLGPFVLVGFSLGGNIALQYSQIPNNHLLGIMMISSAPMKYSQEAMVAYPPYEGSFVAHPDKLTESQAKQYMRAGGFNVDDPSIYFMVLDAMKTDGAARAKMVASVVAGKGIDETEIVSKLTIPLAIVAGAKDSALGLDYMTHLNYANLWRKQVNLIEHASHAIPMHQPDELHLLLETFLREISEKFN
jgi:pimeloyl-ACP methyl ester carboxylesterase